MGNSGSRISSCIDGRRNIDPETFEKLARLDSQSSDFNKIFENYEDPNAIKTNKGAWIAGTGDGADGEQWGGDIKRRYKKKKSKKKKSKKKKSKKTSKKKRKNNKTKHKGKNKTKRKINK